MDIEKLFEKYRKRLTAIGIFKSLFYGLTVGFFTVGVIALLTWLFDCSLTACLAVSLGIGAAAFVLSALIFYQLKFKPNATMIAKKLDSFGLNERVITMYESREKDSYVAQIQRADAREKMKGISAKHIRLTLAMPVIALLIVSFVFAAGCTTVSALAAADIIGHHSENPEGKPDSDDPEDVTPEDDMFTVNYSVYDFGTGHIEGEKSQTVKKGGMTQTVIAVPEDGYMFYAWVDKNMRPFGAQTPERNDINVRENLDIYAYFVEIPPEEQQGPGEDPPPDESGDQQQGGQQQGGQSGGNQGNNGNNGNSGSESQGGDNNGGGEQGGTQVAPDRENNNVIDGSQDYKDAFDREQEEKDLDEDDSLPDDLKDLVGDYFDILDP